MGWERGGFFMGVSVGIWGWRGAMIPSAVCSFVLMEWMGGYGNCNSLGRENGVEEIWN